MHPIGIPSKYVDWVVARRGRRHIFERIDLDRTALLVIDMQNGFLIPGFSPLEVPGLAGIVPNINRLAGRCRESGVLVVWTQQTYTEEWRSWARNFATPEMRDCIIAETAPGARGFAIHDSLDVDGSDLRIVKRRSSAFTPGASDLHERLQASGRDTLIITGTLTNVCCEATARDAMLMNYNTLFVADANGARSDEEHTATLVNMMQFFADVVTTDEVERLIATSANPARDRCLPGPAPDGRARPVTRTMQEVREDDEGKL